MTPPVLRSARRWRTPPVIVHGGGPFEGAAVLEEIGGPLGMLLFQVARDVFMWGDTPPRERAGLFVQRADRALTALIRAADTGPQLKPALRALVRLTHAPEAAQEEQVALACRGVAHWAEQNAHLATAHAFAQCAAVVTPADAALSYEVGGLAQRQGQGVRAETWYRRAVALARRSGDWVTYSSAFVALGDLYMQRGKVSELRGTPKGILRALREASERAAQRLGPRKMEGRALHELLVLAIYAEQPEENVQQLAQNVQHLARAALEAYGPGHERVIGLAWDLAEFWVEHGPASLALMLFQGIVRHAPDDAPRARAHAGVACAAARLGERQLYEEAWEDAWERLSATQFLADDDVALQHLAAAAAGLGDEERAARATERISQFIRDPDPFFDLFGVTDPFSRSRPTRPSAKDHDEAAQNAEPDDIDQAHVLAVDLVRAIEAAQPAS
jgi:tetratricopeptide (TPR) repeat protein